MAHLMRAAQVQAGGVEHPVERLADIGFIERAAGDGGEGPLREMVEARCWQSCRSWTMVCAP